jgi:kynurenine formamidase
MTMFNLTRLRGRGAARALRGNCRARIKRILIAGVLCFSLDVAAQTARTSRDDVARWMKELSNWGRWGKEDQLGAVNLITPAKRRQAAALVKDGVSISLSRVIEKEEAIDNPRPFVHVMMTRPGKNPGETSLFNRMDDHVGAIADTYTVSYHGYASTHLDSLCHMQYDGRMYNGFPDSEISARGAGKLAVTNFSNGLFTRGVLIDIAELRGVPYLEPGTAVFPEEFDAWERKTGVKVTSGDAVFVRTGRAVRRAAKGPWDPREISAGLHAACAPWLRARDAAMLGSDTANDVKPSGVDGVFNPIHQLTLVAMGMVLLDNCELEKLAEHARTRRRWDFLVTAAPLVVPGGTGSPLNPIATF